MTRSHRDDGDDEQGAPDDDERPRTRIDISLSVTDLLGDLLEDAGTESNRRSLGPRPRGRPTNGGSARRPTSDPPETEDDYRVDSFRDDGDLTVVADLPGVAREDVTAGIDTERNELVVAVGGRVTGRVSLPDHPVAVGETSFNNGVLQVRLRATDDGDDSGPERR